MLRNALALYGRYVGASIRSQLQYRTQLVMMLLGTLAVTGSEFVAIWGLFDRFGQIRGWRLPEIALFYGLISITWAVCDALSRGLDVFADLVRSGDFDRLLVRPRSPMLQLLGHELTLRRFGRLAQGAVVLGYAVWAGDIAWTPGRLALLPATIACGACAMLGILVLQATSVFWTIETL